MTTATHPTHDALLAAILADPDADDRRLVYADWLEEYGDEGQRARAEFIRDQVLVVPGSLDWDLLDAYLEAWCPWFERHDKKGFSRRPWSSPPLEVLHLGGEKTVWRRGFIEEVHCSLVAWVGGECRRCFSPAGFSDIPPVPRMCPDCHGTGRTPAAGPDLAARHPVREVRVTDREPGIIPTFSASHPHIVGWWQEGYGPDEMSLPRAVYELLEGQLDDFLLCAARVYDDDAAARRALSDALIRWDRLPRKEPTP